MIACGTYNVCFMFHCTAILKMSNAWKKLIFLVDDKLIHFEGVKPTTYNIYFTFYVPDMDIELGENL